MPLNLSGFELSEVLEASHSVPAAQVQSSPLADRVGRTLSGLAETVRRVGARVKRISSLLRSKEFNATLPNSSPYSHHVAGYAVDFIPEGEDAGLVWERIKPHVAELGIDELGAYDGHIHLSFDPRARGKVFDKRSVIGKAATEAARAGIPKPKTTGVLLLVLIALALLRSRGGFA